MAIARFTQIVCKNPLGSTDTVSIYSINDAEFIWSGSMVDEQVINLLNYNPPPRISFQFSAQVALQVVSTIPCPPLPTKQIPFHASPLDISSGSGSNFVRYLLSYTVT